MVESDLEWRELRAAFQNELEQRTRAIGALLDGLELGGEEISLSSLLEELRREAHGLKGAARAVELSPVEQLAAGLEVALGAAHRLGAAPGAFWFDAVDRAVDALDALVHSEPSPENPPPAYLAEILNGLRAACADAPRPPISSPAPSPVADESFGIDWKELWSAFGLELSERETTIRDAIRRLEPGADDVAMIATLDELRREVHSLKGAARAVELASIERLAHAVETSVAAAKTVGRVPTRAWLDAVDRAVGAVGTLHQAALADDGPPALNVGELLDALAIVWEDEPTPDPETLAAEPEEQADPASEHEVPATPSPEAPRELEAKSVAPGTGVAAPSGEADSPLAAGQFAPPEQAGPPDLHPGTPVRPAETDRPANVTPIVPARVRPDTVRVSVGKLDALLAQAGELTIAEIRAAQRLAEVRTLAHDLQDWRRDWRASKRLRATLRRGAQRGQPTEHLPRAELAGLLEMIDRAEQRSLDAVKRIEGLTLALSLDTAQRGHLVRTVEQEVMRIRLITVDTIFGPFERMIRDLLRDQEKEARLLIEGRETEVDRKVLEKIREPLIHLLRNAVDHGIEPPDSRPRLGKPRIGTIRLSATQRGDVVEIELADDGAGLDPMTLRLTAVSLGLLTHEQAARLDDRQAIELIFRPGFTTRTVVTETSGRGVGMDAVRERILALNGHIDVTSMPGRGTRFTVRVPLSLAMTRAVIIRQRGHQFAIPSSSVERTGRIRSQELSPVDGLRVVEIEDSVVPIADLGEALELASDGPGHEPSDWRPYLVLHDGERRAAFLVDELVDEQQIVVKGLGWPIRRIANVSGSTVLPTGEAIAIVNPFDLLRGAAAASATRADAPSPVHLERKHRVLVVDDSLTTRTLQRSILEAAGFDVFTATDGFDALRVLATEPVDLVVSDVDMPRLDGLGLTAEIRRDADLGQVPIVLVTAHESNERRDQGLTLGADAYLVKSGFDQSRLLETIRELL